MRKKGASSFKIIVKQRCHFGCAKMINGFDKEAKCPLLVAQNGKMGANNKHKRKIMGKSIKNEIKSEGMPICVEELFLLQTKNDRFLGLMHKNLVREKSHGWRHCRRTWRGGVCAGLNWPQPLLLHWFLKTFHNELPSIFGDKSYYD